MQHLEFRNGFAKLLAGVMTLTLLGALFSWWTLGLPLAAHENGPLEWVQEAALLAAAVFSGAAAAGLRGPERIAAYLATLLYLVFLLRELELPPVGPVTTYLASDAFRWHEALALVVLVLPCLVRGWRHWRTFLAYGLSLRGWPFAVAAGLVGLGAVFDGAPHFAGVAWLGTFLEETAELLGYVVLATAAGWVLAGIRSEATTDAVALRGADPIGSQ
ncbi:hypothetical protein [Aureimonas phyllosphaerae]|uniref:Uncharacterized protein n=1 Tax=Aureimonas phyllosphaerae TaxID=1166078 RepID=A0A7W6C0W8_9HYPH|nr:hypothetical protein [Aureimonas phyllosphaerae]MBB3936402.1 hypothetical protein [Aureimonas phyllosphaerae]MBB3960734.1 hypothetical protein [Aureimonas phyllosphaerae]SFF30942.1 hypothetical protein SAMN05216566_107145 [Aureimonas phyllosphaerae]